MVTPNHFWICALLEMGTTSSKQTPLCRESQKANSLSISLGDSKPVNELSGFSAEIESPQAGGSGVCSRNETIEAVLSKSVILCTDNHADEAIQIQNLLQNKFCFKSGIISLK